VSELDSAPAPLIEGEPDTPFWTAWADGERFLLHRCGVCGRHEWPATCCVDHGLAKMAWVAATGTGTIDTFTVFFRAYNKDLGTEVPYTIAVVQLDEGPYFHTRIVGVPPAEVTTRMRVRVRRGAGDAFPLFEPDEP
jgi:uncharacterized OB-fold protein